MASFANQLSELQRLTEESKTKDIISLLKEENNWKSIDSFTKWLAEKAVLSGKGAEAQLAASALCVFAEMADSCILISEPYLCIHLPVMLRCAGSKHAPVRAAAESAVSKTCGKMSANAVGIILKNLFAATEIENNWQTRVLALKMIAGLSDHAPEQLGYSLPQVHHLELNIEAFNIFFFP